MIDLGVAYRRIEAMLQEFELPPWSYAINVEVWNHRHDGEGPSCGFTLSVMAEQCLQAYNAPTMESALMDIERLLRDEAGRRHGAHGVADLLVEVPAKEAPMVAAPGPSAEEEAF